MGCSTGWGAAEHTAPCSMQHRMACSTAPYNMQHVVGWGVGWRKQGWRKEGGSGGMEKKGWGRIGMGNMGKEKEEGGEKETRGK